MSDEASAPEARSRTGRLSRTALAYGLGFLALVVSARLLAGAMSAELPARWMQILVFAGVAGFPVALAIAWMTAAEEAESGIAAPRAAAWGGVGLLVLLAAAYLGMTVPTASPDGTPHAGPPPDPRIVVLPLLELDGRADRTFADGFTDEIAAGLAAVEGLEVRGRVASDPVVDVNRNAADAGRRLGGAAVLDGTLRRSGSRVRLTIRLLDAFSGETLWSVSTDSSHADVFAMRDQVVLGVAGVFGISPGPAAAARLERRRTTAEAMNLYFLGRYRWAAGAGGDLLEAASYYELAIAADSGFAPAWAALAESYATLPRFTRFPTARARADGAAAARTALRLDPDAAEAHVALGEILFLYERDWSGAESHFVRAIELDPGDAAPRDRLCEMKLYLGDLEAAGRACAGAAVRDPGTFRTAWLMAGVASAGGDQGAALRGLDSLARLYPDFEPLAADLAIKRLTAGDSTDALRTDLTIWFELLGGGEAADSLARSISAGGEDAVAALGRLERELDPDPAHRVAMLTQLGQETRAAALAGSTLVARVPGSLRYGVFPEYAPIRQRPEVRNLLEEAGLVVR